MMVDIMFHLWNFFRRCYMSALFNDGDRVTVSNQLLTEWVGQTGTVTRPGDDCTVVKLDKPTTDLPSSHELPFANLSLTK